MSVSSLADRLAFVMVRPKAPGNVGAAARAVKNMGFRDLRIVAPEFSDLREAATMAVHAEDVLAAAQVYPELAAAIRDCTIGVGTTARKGKYRSEIRPLREAVGELAACVSANRIALIFGPEDFGLSNDDLKLCQRLITIPSAAEYPSLNLAQAVMLTAYEMRLALDGANDDASREPYAPTVEVDAMFERMAAALIEIGFLPADNPDHLMVTLRAVFSRSGLYDRELDIFNGIARQIRWAAEGGFVTLEAKRRSGRRFR